MSDAYKKGYKVETLFNQSTGMPLGMIWKNDQGNEEAPGDLASEMRFTDKGVLLLAKWRTNGKLDRLGDLPSEVFYDKVSGKPYAFCWHRNGIEHREGNRPSSIEIDPETRALKVLQFCKNGHPFRSGGLPTYISFGADGKAYDIDGYIIDFTDFDVTWIPEQSMPKLI